MAWVSKYNAQFTKTLIRQLVAIVQRDQRAALDFVGGANVLLDIQTYQIAHATLPQFPAVLIAPMNSQFVQEAVGSLQSGNKIYCAVAVAHQNSQVLAELSQDYVRALDAIFNTLTSDNNLYQFYQSWPLTLPSLGGGGNLTSPAGPTPGSIQTTPLAAGSVKELFVVSHQFDEIRRARNSFVQAATLEVVIDREET